MKSSIKKLIPLLALIVVISLAGTTQARPFALPSAAFPGNNTEFPVNVSSIDQVKVGGIAVEGFSAMQNAGFEKNVYLTSYILGKNGLSENPSKLSFGGTDQSGVDRSTDVVVNGDLTISSGTYANSLRHGTGSGGTLKPVCASADGSIVHCPIDLSGIVPYFVAVSEEEATPVGYLECENGGNTPSGDYVVNVNMEFFASKGDYTASQTTFMCTYFPTLRLCNTDMTGKGLKISYILNGNTVKTADQVGNHAVLLSNLKKGFYAADTYSCSSEFIPENTYQVLEGLSEPVPYQTQ